MYAYQTLEEYVKTTPVRLFGPSTFDEGRTLLHRGAARTIFCEGRVFFEAGPPAFFCGETRNALTIGAAGLGADGFGNDGFEDCQIPGPSRHQRAVIAAGGEALGLEELEREIKVMPGWSAVPKFEQKIETFCAHPVGEAALLSERQFPIVLRMRLDQWPVRDLHQLLKRHDREMWSWLRAPGSEVLTRRIVERFAEGCEPALEFRFHCEIEAARAILRRLRAHGLARRLEEADEAALERFGL